MRRIPSQRLLQSKQGPSAFTQSTKRRPSERAFDVLGEAENLPWFQLLTQTAPDPRAELVRSPIWSKYTSWSRIILNISGFFSPSVLTQRFCSGHSYFQCYD
jgi:hypothetical protein